MKRSKYSHLEIKMEKCSVLYLLGGANMLYLH